MQLEHLGDPARFDPRIRAARMSVKEVYSPAICSGLQQLATARKRDEYTASVMERVIRDLADRAIWAMTEISPDPDTKYLGQQYITVGVRTRWLSKECGSGKVSRIACFKAQGACILRHEHVIPWSLLRKLLVGCQSPAEVDNVLDSSVACVVLKVEDRDRISRHGCGWERYEGLDVYDRETDTRVTLAELQARQFQLLPDHLRRLVEEHAGAALISSEPMLK